MKVLAILSQKGGVGKTTLATCLAVAAEQAGKVAAIIDLDPQATASFWKDVRQLDTPAVASIQPVRLPAMLKACEDAGTDLVVIDGAAVARDVLEKVKAKYPDISYSDLWSIGGVVAVQELVSTRGSVAIDLAEPFSTSLN